MAVDGATVRCGGCSEVVYPDCKVLANHTITTRPDGRVHWWSRDFETTVHLCDSAPLPAVAAAIELASGLVLRYLTASGMRIPADR